MDADITELNLVTTHQHEWQHQLSEEITISHQQPRLTWVGGVFLFDEFDHQSFWVDQPAAGFQVRLDPRVDATSRAVFGQATVGLTSRLSATAGLRYTHEGKDIDNAGGRYAPRCSGLPVPGSVYGYSDSIAHSAWTPKIGLEMKLPNGALAYVSATRGFKSGGFNPSSTAAGRGYAPEWAWSYEGGWKGTLMGGRPGSACRPSSWITRTCRYRRPSASGSSTSAMPQPRRFAASKWRTRHGSGAASKPEAM